MTTTEPAARLTLHLTEDQPDSKYLSIVTPHGEVVAPRRLGVTDAAVGYILDAHDAKAPGCHCADAIRARYGAGGA